MTSGTYFNAARNVTYIFSENGTCTKNIPDQQNPGTFLTFDGTWTAGALGTNLDLELDMGIVTVQLLETFENAFTTDNGAKLYLMGLKQEKPDGGELMKFVGKSRVRSILYGGPEQDSIFHTETTLKVNSDGTWKSTTVFEGASTPNSGFVDLLNLKLIEHNGAYFYQQPDSFLFLRE